VAIMDLVVVDVVDLTWSWTCVGGLGRGLGGRWLLVAMDLDLSRDFCFYNAKKPKNLSSWAFYFFCICSFIIFLCVYLLS
jgi:hypothetical protein